MFVHYEKEQQKVPIKIWLNNINDIESGCLEQAINLSNLPFVYKWVSLMPDTHQGYGMPIGGVIATEDIIIPNAVGVDIGCGMGFIETNIPVLLLKETETPNGILTKAIISNIMRNIPTGFSHHTNLQECHSLDNINFKSEKSLLIGEELMPEINKGYYQVGTLGGGNHFIELQEDENGLLSIMLHSGSRNFGYKICKLFNNKAKELNEKWLSLIPQSYDLAFLPLNSDEGIAYVDWMNLALQFAQENRNRMMEATKSVVFNMVKKHTGFTGIEIKQEINAHHNYASIENHYDKNVWVHRKGAIRVRKDELGIIPSAMGGYSYIVKGLGNPESFMSCSHGAGRAMSRKKAMEKFTVEETIKDLKEQGIILGKNNKSNCNDECRWAYKNIDEVINNELDLIVPIKKLKTLAVVKG